MRLLLVSVFICMFVASVYTLPSQQKENVERSKAIKVEKDLKKMKADRDVKKMEEDDDDEDDDEEDDAEEDDDEDGEEDAEDRQRRRFGKKKMNRCKAWLRKQIKKLVMKNIKI